DASFVHFSGVQLHGAGDGSRRLRGPIVNVFFEKPVSPTDRLSSALLTLSPCGNATLTPANRHTPTSSRFLFITVLSIPSHARNLRLVRRGTRVGICKAAVKSCETKIGRIYLASSTGMSSGSPPANIFAES